MTEEFRIQPLGRCINYAPVLAGTTLVVKVLLDRAVVAEEEGGVAAVAAGSESSRDRGSQMCWSRDGVS